MKAYFPYVWSNHHGFSSCNLLDENFTETRFVIELILHAEPETQSAQNWFYLMKVYHMNSHGTIDFIISYWLAKLSRSGGVECFLYLNGKKQNANQCDTDTHNHNNQHCLQWDIWTDKEDNRNWSTLPDLELCKCSFLFPEAISLIIRYWNHNNKNL